MIDKRVEYQISQIGNAISELLVRIGKLEQDNAEIRKGISKQAEQIYDLEDRIKKQENVFEKGWEMIRENIALIEKRVEKLEQCYDAHLENKHK